MPISEDVAIERALQSYGHISKLTDLGLKPQDLAGMKVVDLGAGKDSSLKRDLQKLGIQADVLMVDGNPISNSDVQRGKFSNIPALSNSVDLLISRNAFPMYLPADNPELAVQSMGEIKRVLKVGGEARLSPWTMTSSELFAKGVMPNLVSEQGAPEIFQAMKNVPGLTFQLVSEGDKDPRSGEIRRSDIEMMIIRKT